MSRYTVIEREPGRYGIEDNEADIDSPDRVLNFSVSLEVAKRIAQEANRDEEWGKQQRLKEERST
jgi:hypothetical protein